MAQADIGLRIFLDDAISSGLGLVNSNLGQFGAQLLNLASFASMASSQLQALIPWFAAIAGSSADFALFSSGLEDAVKAAGSLQDSLVSVQIALNATDAEMVSLGQSITQIADNSIFSTQEVADGFTELAHRGYDAQQITGGLGQAMVNLAEATGTQTVPAATLLASTMKVYGANAADAEKYASALTFAFENGIPDVNDLTSSMEQVAGSVELANVPLNQLIPVLDYLHQNGLPGATQAATSLRYMMQGLIHPTAQASQELANLGIITVSQATPAFDAFEAKLASTGKTAANLVNNFDGTTLGLQGLYNEAKRMGVLNTDQTFTQWATSLGMLNNKLYDSHGNIIDLYGVLQVLGDKISQLPTQQDKLQALLALFNVRSGSGADILLSNIAKVMPALDGLTNKMNAFTQADGAMKNAGERAGTLDGEFKKLTTTFGSFMASIGAPLLAPLTSLVGWLNSLVSTTMNGKTSVSEFGAIFLTVGTVLSGVASVAGVAALAFIFMDGALLPIIGVAAAVAVGIAAVAAGAALVATNWNTLKPILNAVANALIGVVAAAAGIGGSIALGMGAVSAFTALTSISWGPLIAGLAQSALGLLQVGIRAVVAAGQTAMYIIMSNGGLLPAVVAVTGALIAEAAAWLLANGPIILIVGLFAGAVIGLIALVQHFGGLNVVLKVGQAIWNDLAKVFGDIGNQIKQTVMQALKDLQPTWTQLVQAFNTAKPVLMVLGAGLGLIAAIVVGVLIGAFRGLLGIVVPVIQTIVAVIKGFIQVVSGIAQIFMGVFTIINGIIHGNGNMVMAGIKQIGQGILSIFQGLWTAVSGVFTGAFNAIKGFVTGFIQGIIGFFQHLADTLVHHSIIPDMVMSILSWIASLPGKAISSIVSMVTGMVNAALGLAGKFHDHVIQPIIDKLGSLASQAVQLGANILKNLASGIIGAIASTIGNAMNALGTFIHDHLPHSPAKMGPLMKLHEQGAEIPNQIALGVHSNIGVLGAAAQRMGNVLSPQTFGRPSSLVGLGAGGAGAGAGNSSTFNLQVDGKTFTSFVLDHTTNTLKMNGMGRTLK